MEDVWYKEGLRFQCTGCGGCCTGAPGYVWLTEEDILAIAEFLDLPLQEFADRFLRSVNGKISLREISPSNDCVFLEDKKRCSIYAARPKQCRTFPFWPNNLKSKSDWEKAALACEGISLNAPLISLEEIRKRSER